ncbi:MAG: rRNA maturation RNase YbeY [Hyphomicrobiales bacterium]|nr:MAG: rRNA maturation RNase YbeY [Hyphomicrobiales bacterium]
MTMPAALTIDIAFDDAGWPGPPALEALARKVLALAWARARRGADSEVAVLFSSDERVRGLNRDFRAQDKPTNVLSFPAGEAPAVLPGPRPLGDIVLAFETTSCEAGEAGRALEAHAAHLVVHGFLHLLGYDHQDDSQAAQMEREETLILAEAGFDDPYRLNHV